MARAVPALPLRLGRPGHQPTFSLRGYESLLRGGLAVVAFLLAWELASANRVINGFLVSRPSLILGTAYRLLSSGQLNDALAISAQELATGYVIAVAVAVPFGLALGWYTYLDYAVDPLLAVLYSVPKVAYLPLILIWIGIGIEAKILMVFIGAFFPLVINVRAGVRTLDHEYIRLSRSFGASELFRFRTVIIPGTIPFLLTGLRLAAARALVGLVLGELYAGNAGIGYLMTIAGVQFRVTEMFVGVLIIAAVGLLMNAILGRVERLFDAWRPVATR